MSPLNARCFHGTCKLGLIRASATTTSTPTTTSNPQPQTHNGQPTTDNRQPTTHRATAARRHEQHNDRAVARTASAGSEIRRAAAGAIALGRGLEQARVEQARVRAASVTATLEMFEACESLKIQFG